MERYQTALEQYNAGQHQQAALLCEQILAADPRQGNALNLMGLIQYQHGHHDQAIDFMRQAVAAEPDNLARLCNLGCLLEGANRRQEAEEVLRQALRIKPDFPEAFYNLGLCLHNQGRLAEAQEAYEQALSLHPSYREALYNLGILMKGMGELAVAEQYFQRCLALAPEDPDLLNELGHVLYHNGKKAQAVELFQKLTALTPEKSEAWYNLGVALLDCEQATEAEITLRRCLELAPSDARAHNNLGLALYDQQRYGEAEQCQRQALIFNQHLVSAWCDLGLTLHAQERLPEAEEAYSQALALDPAFTKAHYNLGNLYRDQNQTTQAITAYRKAIQLEPAMAEANWNLAIALLLNGEYDEGWQQYEWRWQRSEAPPRLTHLPEWDGTTLTPDQPLLAYAEQGFGDTLQFLRFLEPLRNSAPTIVLVCQAPLVPLAKASFPWLAVHAKEELHQVMGQCVFQVSLLSLPGMLKITLANLPATVPYLKIPAAITASLQQIVDSNNGLLHIGLVWEGNPANSTYAQKICPLELLLPLAQLPQVRLYSLQKENTRELPEEITDLSPYLEDFAATGAIMAELDLIISIDTAAAHLAGALGRRVWTLLPHVPPDWRFMLHREDTPWYPTMRLWRQDRDKQWAPVIARLTKELGRLKPGEPIPQIQPDTNRTTGEYAGQTTSTPAQPTLYLGLSSGENFGWGVCSKYLSRELANILPVKLLTDNTASQAAKLPGSLFTALTGVDFFSLFEQARGERNYGYTFFENELTPNSLANAQQYDRIFAGSTWCLERMAEKGIHNTGLLIQGIDPDIFYPAEETETAPDRPFTIFSGGKFELRKGQDLVLAAFKILQEKYPDMVLINCWQNIWPQTMRLMAVSPHIRYTHREGDWQQVMAGVYADNGLNANRITTLPLQDNATLRELYLQTDIGLFPNRCEGGTNLVLMEYMACGRPVIATNTSGHKDIVHEGNALLLNKLADYHLVNDQRGLMARWQEPAIDEIVATVEYAYHHRHAIQDIGRRAGNDLKKFTWTQSARQLIEQIQL